MAKFKFSDARITDIVAILDRDDDGKFILTLDDEQFDFEQILADHVGDVVAIKFTRDIEWGELWIGKDLRMRVTRN